MIPAKLCLPSPLKFIPLPHPSILFSPFPKAKFP